MAKKGVKSWTRHEDSILLQYCVTKGPAFCLLALEADGFIRTEPSVVQRCAKLGLRYVGPKLGLFKKGHIPVNKGKKMSPEVYEKARHTFFQKGSRHGAANSNYSPIGTETIRADGYTWVKLAEKQWEQKHRLVWQNHFGSIPENHLVRFRDGNPQNFDPKNLELITRQEHAVKNRHGDGPSEFSLITGRAAKSNLKRRGIGAKAIRENPDLLKLAEAQLLLKNKIRKRHVNSNKR